MRTFLSRVMRSSPSIDPTSRRRCATSLATARSCSAARSTRHATSATLARSTAGLRRKIYVHCIRLDDRGNGEEEVDATRLLAGLERRGQRGCEPARGLDETLTVMRLNLPATLRRTFATTNAIENMNGSLRRTARNVKQWKDEKMIRRWVALGIAEAVPPGRAVANRLTRQNATGRLWTPS